jgi:hypothetical protein
VPDLPQWKTNFNFYGGVSEKFMYDWPKSLLDIRIPVQMDPDLIGQVRILERTMAVRSQLDSELQQNPLDLRTLIFCL